MPASELEQEQLHAAVVNHLAARLMDGGLLCMRRCYICDYVTQLPLDDQLAFVPLAAERAREIVAAS